MQRSLLQVVLRQRRKICSRFLPTIHFRIHHPLKSWSEILTGAYSRRINIQHRIVYEVFVQERTVRVLRMWTHYD